jgi:hypothetical protein
MSNIYSPAGATRHIMASASVAGPFLMGQQGLMTTRRVCARIGGLSATFKTRGLCWLGGGETCRRLIMRLRIGDWEIVAGAAARLPIPRIKEDDRAATWQSQQRHVFADSHVI